MKYMPIFFLIVLLGCVTSERDKKIEALVALASQSDSLQQYRKSVEIYTDILRMDSASILALTNRGRGYVWSGEVKKGFADYDKAVQIHPGVSSYFRRGIAYVYINEYQKALSDLRKVVSLNPKFSEAYYWLSSANSKSGNLDSARYYCYRADSIGYMKEFSISVWYEVYMNAKEYKQAASVMTKAIADFPGNYIWFNNRAVARNYFEEFEGSVEDCNRAILLNPAFGFAYNNKGYALMGLNKLDSSLFYINRSLKLAPGNAYAYKNRAVVLLLLRNKEQACRDLDQALSLGKEASLIKEIADLRDKHCHH
jgi:tetratricopeptide (TPR) repeat protein